MACDVSPVPMFITTLIFLLRWQIRILLITLNSIVVSVFVDFFFESDKYRIRNISKKQSDDETSRLVLITFLIDISSHLTLIFLLRWRISILLITTLILILSYFDILSQLIEILQHTPSIDKQKTTR